MKPIEYKEIDNPASLLKKLNEMVESINHTFDALKDCVSRVYLDQQLEKLNTRIPSSLDLIGSLELATKVGNLEKQVASIVGLITPAVVEVLERDGTLPRPSTSETDRAKTSTKDDKDITPK